MAILINLELFAGSLIILVAILLSRICLQSCTGRTCRQANTWVDGGQR
jgi:hypothetical protein